MFSKQKLSYTVKAPLQIAVALCLLSHSALANALSGCDNDGFAVEFKEKKGVLELDDVKVREITGNNRDELEIGLGSSGIQPVVAYPGQLNVNNLAVHAFPDNNINSASIERLEKGVWSVEFDKGDYEFADKSDLQLDIQVSVINNQITHASGAASTATIEGFDSGIDIKWHGGKRNYLKEVKGDLNFRLTDLAQLGLIGTYSANIELCVNIRGNL